MVRTIPDEVVRLADVQGGMLTRAQLRAAGMGDEAVRNRLCDLWRQVLPGVVLLSRGPLDAVRRAVAAQLFAGPESLVSGAAGARLHGLGNAGSSQTVTVLVPAHQSSRRAGFAHVQRTHRMPSARRQIDGVRVVLPARAVADACRLHPDVRYAKALVIEAVQRKVTGVTRLCDELFSGPRRGSATLRAAIAVAATGAWSVAEHDLLRVVQRSTVLPRPWLNPVVTAADGSPLPTPDLWFDDVGLAVQVQSHAYHAAGERWTETIRADSALGEAGVVRVAVTPSEIRDSPDDVLRRIERVYLQRSPATRPPVKAVERRPT
ncbi:hypothetical protein [Cellulomonas composti]|uniref:AbiEi antitoxin C-terminal domain-containing protein n=1 Tax=Cellulomonas composti TaxID=266130 RepID=A0A511J9L4_9CELL|nr:hypothetical protein [Cellulomonas composti]GEL94670.1 hypothetical protein CCO02nite_13280 [Cellulomonas composti]